MANVSLRKAINDHCKWCIYDEKSGLGTWRAQVEGCTSPNCSLFPVRPKTTKKNRLKANIEDIKQ